MGSSIRGRPNHWVLKPQTESMAACQGMRISRPPSLSIPACLSLSLSFPAPSAWNREETRTRRALERGDASLWEPLTPLWEQSTSPFALRCLHCHPPSSRGQPCLCLALSAGGEENEMEVHIGQNPNILQIICPHHQAPVSHIGITTKRKGKKRQHGETRLKIILGLTWQWAMSQYSVPACIVTCAHVKSN